MSRHEFSDRPLSPLDRNAYAAMDGRIIRRPPDKYREEEADAAKAPTHVDELRTIARRSIEAHPALHSYFIDGQSLASMATILGCHRSTALRRFRRYLYDDVRLQLVAEIVCIRSLRDRGGTFNVRTGSVIVEDAWAVGIKKFGKRVPSLTPAVIQKYLHGGPSDLPFGAFFDKGMWGLDRVRLVADDAEAIRLGIQEEQSSIFHLSRKQLHVLSQKMAA